MPQLVALSLSIAVLGAVWAFLALGPLSGFVLVWAGFIAWGCFFHTGGDDKALVKTIVGNAYGSLIAWIALLVIVNVPVAGLGPVWPAIVVVHRPAIGGTGERLRLCRRRRLLAASALRGARFCRADGHRSAPEPWLGELRQPADPAHRLNGDRRDLRLPIGSTLQILGQVSRSPGIAHFARERLGAGSPAPSSCRPFRPAPGRGPSITVARSVDL